MHNVGEEIAGEYLRVCKDCEFVEYNLYTPDIQGEIDVVGINLRAKTVYLCEVAVHLATGLMYVDQKSNQPNNVKKLIQKLEKDREYAIKYFPATLGYNHVLMLWSPIIKQAHEGSKHNQTKDIVEIQRYFAENHKINLHLIINQAYQDCLAELRDYAASQTKELKSPVLRYLQIEESLSKHLKNLTRIQKTPKPS